MGAIHYAMSDIYGGYAGTTEQTIPDADDQNALTDTSQANTRPVKSAPINTASNSRMYLALLLVLILVIVIGGRF